MTNYGFLSTYPPTRCGLATFPESLAAAITDGSEHTAAIVRALEHLEAPPVRGLPSRVRIAEHLVAGDRGSITRTATALNSTDVAIIQHEYGIFGGPEGDEVLAVLKTLRVPTIVVLHTVLASPSARQREVLEAVCALATAVVVMTEAARENLRLAYTVPLAKVTVIPHGIASWTSGAAHAEDGVRRVLTWGLIGPGKGLEWGIRAMALLRDLSPAPEYLIVGQTHPKVLAHHGEEYRERLQRLVDELGLTDSVTLDAQYYDGPRLAATVAAADVVLLPYDSRVQVTSGVLVEATAAHVPVVATAFPHAVEVLGGGAGIVVPHENPDAIADAIRQILTRPEVAQGMSAAAPGAGDLTWREVAARYRALARRVAGTRAA